MCNALQGVQCYVGDAMGFAMLCGVAAVCAMLWGGGVQCPTGGWKSSAGDQGPTSGPGDSHVPNVPYVPTGFERVQSFRKSDGSYGAWLHRGSSTW